MRSKKLVLIVSILSLSACTNFLKGVNEGYYAAEDAEYADAAKRIKDNVYQQCDKVAPQSGTNSEHANCVLEPLRQSTNSFVTAFNKYKSSYLDAAKALDAKEISSDQYTNIVENHTKEFTAAFKDLRSTITPEKQTLFESHSLNYAKESYDFITNTFNECNAKMQARQIKNEVERTQCVLVPMTERVNSYANAYNKYDATFMEAAKAWGANQIDEKGFSKMVEVPRDEFSKAFNKLRSTFTE